MAAIRSSSDLVDYLQERDLVLKIRKAVQFCKAETDISTFTDTKMGPEQRLLIEKCLTQNYLFKYGMDYFGKRDLIYIDMEGDIDVSRFNKTTKDEEREAQAE